MNGIPEDFCFDQLPEDFDHFEPILEKAVKRMPLLATAGIHTFFNGPGFTPDDRYYLGEAPNCKNFWVCCGFNSIGIQSSGGAGMALAQWMEDGEPFDLWDVDIRRVQPSGQQDLSLQPLGRDARPALRRPFPLSPAGDGARRAQFAAGISRRAAPCSARRPAGARQLVRPRWPGARIPL